MNRPRNGSLTGIICAAILFLSTVSVPATVEKALTEVPSPATNIAALRNKIDPLIAGSDDIALRQQATDVYKIVDALLAQGDERAVLHYLERVLRADPRAFDYQLIYGEILARNGEAKELFARADQAIQQAEEDQIIRRAYNLIGRPLPPPPHPLTHSPNSKPELVLLQADGASVFWLADLRAVLEAKLGIIVSIAQNPVHSGKPDRTGIQQFAAMMRRRLLESLATDPQLANYLRSLKIERTELESNDDTVIRTVRIFIENSDGAKGVTELESRLRAAEDTGQQWAADKLLAQIDNSVEPFKQPQRWFLAVTDCDLYSPGNNFVFGMAGIGGTTGLISAKRFSAHFNDERPTRKRLIARLSKQALSSYGFLLGVPRCTTPDCPRSYPNSLTEHDAKTENLCPKCRTGFERVLETALPD